MQNENILMAISLLIKRIPVKHGNWSMNWTFVNLRKKLSLISKQENDKALLLKWLRPLTVTSQIVDIHDLVRGIPRADTQPGHYFTVPTDKTLSLNSCSANEVQKLLEKLEVKKATGLDNLPSKFLKIAADILAPSLTFQRKLTGPLLFLIFINDLPNWLTTAIPRMYADDTSISFAASSLPELVKVQLMENLLTFTNG